MDMTHSSSITHLYGRYNDYSTVHSFQGHIELYPNFFIKWFMKRFQLKEGCPLIGGVGKG